MGVIVVGVDESDSASAALRWAVEQSRRRHWGVRAVLAWSYLDQHHDRGEGSFRPDYSEQDAVDVLDRWVDEAVPGAEVERVATCDLPGRALLEASRAADLLVMGARSGERARRGSWGPVVQRCVRRAVVPVTIVRPIESAVGRGSVVIGVDGSGNSARALRWGIDEARLRGAAVTIVHANQRSSFGSSRQSRQDGRRVLEAMLEEHDSSGTRPADLVVVERGGAKALLDASHDAALVVVGSGRGRGGLARRLARLDDPAASSVVVVPPTEPSGALTD